jgi:prepilin-type N-terminal cleavage/methylation domain-containing protein
MRGFTLIELLVALLIGSVAICSEVALFRVHAQVARRTQSDINAAASAAWALSVVARDFELAGTDPLLVGVVALRQAGGERVVLDADLDGDGLVDPGSAERVTISWSAQGGGRLLRALGNQSMNIATRVPSAGFHIRYFDRDGAELLPAAGGDLDAANADAVRRVELEHLVAEPFDASESRVTLRTGASLRSRSGGA